jgi:hypothetical protein
MLSHACRLTGDEVFYYLGTPLIPAAHIGQTDVFGIGASVFLYIQNLFADGEPVRGESQIGLGFSREFTVFEHLSAETASHSRPRVFQIKAEDVRGVFLRCAEVDILRLNRQKWCNDQQESQFSNVLYKHDLILFLLSSIRMEKDVLFSEAWIRKLNT